MKTATAATLALTALLLLTACQTTAYKAGLSDGKLYCNCKAENADKADAKVICLKKVMVLGTSDQFKDHEGAKLDWAAGFNDGCAECEKVSR